VAASSRAGRQTLTDVSLRWSASEAAVKSR
jgi:hypothetical protein